MKRPKGVPHAILQGICLNVGISHIWFYWIYQGMTYGFHIVSPLEIILDTDIVAHKLVHAFFLKLKLEWLKEIWYFSKNRRGMFGDIPSEISKEIFIEIPRRISREYHSKISSDILRNSKNPGEIPRKFLGEIPSDIFKWIVRGISGEISSKISWFTFEGFPQEIPRKIQK